MRTVYDRMKRWLMARIRIVHAASDNTARLQLALDDFDVLVGKLKEDAHDKP